MPSTFGMYSFVAIALSSSSLSRTAAAAPGAQLAAQCFSTARKSHPFLRAAFSFSVLVPVLVPILSAGGERHLALAAPHSFRFRRLALVGVGIGDFHQLMTKQASLSDFHQLQIMTKQASLTLSAIIQYHMRSSIPFSSSRTILSQNRNGVRSIF